MHEQIDALIVNNCSWSPVPSLASFVVNTFKFKSTCLTYNLSGMGCTATAIATHLAQELLQVRGLALSIQWLLSSCNWLGTAHADCALWVPSPPSKVDDRMLFLQLFRFWAHTNSHFSDNGPVGYSFSYATLSI